MQGAPPVKVYVQKEKVPSGTHAQVPESNSPKSPIDKVHVANQAPSQNEVPNQAPLQSQVPNQNEVSTSHLDHEPPQDPPQAKNNQSTPIKVPPTDNIPPGDNIQIMPPTRILLSHLWMQILKPILFPTKFMRPLKPLLIILHLPLLMFIPQTPLHQNYAHKILLS